MPSRLGLAIKYTALYGWLPLKTLKTLSLERNAVYSKNDQFRTTKNCQILLQCQPRRIYFKANADNKKYCHRIYCVLGLQGGCWTTTLRCGPRLRSCCRVSSCRLHSLRSVSGRSCCDAPSTTHRVNSTSISWPPASTRLVFWVCSLFYW